MGTGKGDAAFKFLKTETSDMKYFFLFFFFGALFSCNQQEDKQPDTDLPVKKDTIAPKADNANPYATPDRSPMDMVYFPVDYPILKMTKSISGGPYARVIYSRPQKQGRKIFGELLKYGEHWRLGANEATEIEFFVPAVIQDKKVNADRYILYCIPREDNWTIVLNSNIDSWGLQQDTKKDILRFVIPVQKLNASIEYFTIAFEKTGEVVNLVMTWDNVLAKLPITW